MWDNSTEEGSTQLPKIQSLWLMTLIGTTKRASEEMDYCLFLCEAGSSHDVLRAAHHARHSLGYCLEQVAWYFVVHTCGDPPQTNPSIVCTCHQDMPNKEDQWPD